MANSFKPSSCFLCNKEITLYKNGCQALGHSYHVDCFLCATCGNQLAGVPFYTIEDKIYCKSDFMKLAEKCVLLRAFDSNYHPKCFVCKACRCLLENVPFKIHPEFGMHCMECYRLCAMCRKPIVPESGKTETSQILALEKSFHVECYVCEDCGLKLSSKIAGHECYPLDDRLLCKNCNFARRNKKSFAN